MALTDTQLVSGGVVPVGFVEPLNQWQRSGLEALAGGNTAGLNYLAMAGQAAQRGTDLGMSPEDFASGTASFMNPYIDQVLNRTTARLNESAQQAKAKIMAKEGFRKAFGSTSQGAQLGEIDRGLTSDIGDATATLSYQGFNDAANRYMSQFNTERSRDLQGAGVLSGIASQARATSMDDIMNRIKAGTVVQGQNQSILDVLNPEIKGVQNYGKTQLQDLMSFLSAFKPTQYQSGFSQDPNTAARAGNTLTAIGGIKGIDWGSIFGGSNAPATMGPFLP